MNKLPVLNPSKSTVLFCGDDIRLHTGFANQLQKIVRAIKDTGEYNILRISCFPPRSLETSTSLKSYDGLLIPESTDDTVFYCDSSPHVVDRYGDTTFGKVLNHYQPDIVFTINDLQNVAHVATEKQSGKTPFVWIHYLPIDGSPAPSGWGSILHYIDTLVVYGQYGYAEIKSRFQHVEQKMQVMPHVVDLDIFKPGTDQQRSATRRKMGWTDKFVFTYVGRTHTRKCVDRLMRAFKLFIDDGVRCFDCNALTPGYHDGCPKCGSEKAEYFAGKPDAALYLHAPPKDEGDFDLETEIRKYSLDGRVIRGGNDCVGHGVSDHELAAIMDASDVHVNASYGEGWCLHPDTRVIAASGIPCIGDLEINTCDFAYARDGAFWEIEKVLSREYAGTLYSVYTDLDSTPVKITPEHTIFVLNKMKKNIDPYACSAEQLSEVTAQSAYKAFQKGKPVYVAFPRPLESDSIGKISVSGYSVDMVPLLGTFLGSYMASGLLADNTVTFDVSLVPSSKRKEYRTALEDAIKAFDIAKGRDICVHKMSVVVKGEEFATFVRGLFGFTNDVTFPHFWTVRSLYTWIVKAFVLGASEVLKGQVRVQCPDYIAAWQLRFMLFSHSIVGKIKSVANRHYVCIEDKGKNLHNLQAITGVDYTPIRKESKPTGDRCFIVGEKYILAKITDISEEQYQGTVYNLHVPEVVSYTTSQFLVHNCVPIHEAMAVGRPVIVPDHSALSHDLVEDGINGLTVQSSGHIVTSGGIERPLIDEPALAAAMELLYNDDADAVRRQWFGSQPISCSGTLLREQLGQRARSSVQKYDMPIVMQKWVDLFALHDTRRCRTRMLEMCSGWSSKDSAAVTYIADFFDPPVGGAEHSAMSLLSSLGRIGGTASAISFLPKDPRGGKTYPFRHVDNVLSLRPPGMTDIVDILYALGSDVVLSSGAMTPRVSGLLSDLGIYHAAILNDFLGILPDQKYGLGHGADNDAETLLAYSSSTFRGYDQLVSNIHAIKLADTVVANSDWTQRTFDLRYGIVADKTMFPFIRWSAFPIRPGYPSVNDEKDRYRYMIGMVRPSHAKGIATLLKIARRLPHLIFCVFGPAVENEPYAKMFSEIRNIKWIPDPGDMAEAYDKMLALLVPSWVEETFGMVSIEAMACDVPVIHSDRGALSWMPECGGIGVDPIRIDSYIKTLEVLLSCQKIFNNHIFMGRETAGCVKRKNERDISDVSQLVFNAHEMHKVSSLMLETYASEFTPKIDVVIPCYKDTSMTIRAIRSAIEHGKCADVTFHVVAQCCQQPIEESDWLKVYSFDEGLGWAKACNVGAENCAAPWVIFANSDVLFGPYWDACLCQKADLLEKRGIPGVISPVTNHAINPIQCRGRGFVNPANHRYFSEMVAKNNFGKWVAAERYVGFVFMCQLDTYREMGGLDENFGCGGYDDNDFSIRMREIGGQIIIAEDCHVYHYGGETITLARNEGYDYNTSIVDSYRYILDKHGVDA